MGEPLNTAQFAAKIRQAHPGAYDDLADTELTDKVLAKFPQYQDMVQTKFERDRDPANHKGFIANAKEELRNFGAGLVAKPEPITGIVPVDMAIHTAINMAVGDQERATVKRSMLYRVIAGLGSMLGINARGMEAGAETGDPGRIGGTAIADAVPVIAAAAAPAIVGGVAKTGGRIVEAAAPVVKSAATKTATMAGKAAETLGRVGDVSANAVGIVSPRAANALRLANDMATGLTHVKRVLDKLKAEPSFISDSDVHEYVTQPNTGLDVSHVPPARPKGYAATQEDAAASQDARQNLDAEGQKLNREAWDRGTPQATPKWQQVAEVKAQAAYDKVMRDMQSKATTPAAKRVVQQRAERAADMVVTSELKKAASSGEFVVPGANEDLTELLEKSLAHVNAKKAGK